MLGEPRLAIAWVLRQEPSYGEPGRIDPGRIDEDLSFAGRGPWVTEGDYLVTGGLILGEEIPKGEVGLSGIEASTRREEFG